MKNPLIHLYILLILPLCSFGEPPITPGAFNSSSDILKYLDQVAAEGKILSGQHNNLNALDVTWNTKHAVELTARWPAIIGLDMGSGLDNWTAATFENYRNALVTTAIEYWRNGGLVTICWHQTTPVNAIDTGGFNAVLRGGMTDDQFNQIITPGTLLYNNWLRHVDLIASYLLKLQAADVPVIFRPYHEPNVRSFWWGARSTEAYQRLWNNLYERLVIHHRLKNLIWHWSIWEGPLIRNQFPGLSKIDVGGVDVYQSDRNARIWTESHTFIDEIVGSKPHSLSENGLFPSEALARKLKFSYFLTWGKKYLDRDAYDGSGQEHGNTAETVKEFYAHPFVITREQVRMPRSYECEHSVYRSSSATTRRTTDILDETYGGGGFVQLVATGPGPFVEFDLFIPYAGAWSISIKTKRTPTSGATAASFPALDSKEIGVGDLYAPHEEQAEILLGTYTFPASGLHTIRFTITGKNEASTGYSVLFDYIKLTPK